MRIPFDKNVPVGGAWLPIGHDVSTFVDTQWDLQLENGELLKCAEAPGFQVMVTADQNCKYQQNLKGGKLDLNVSGCNIWPIVRAHEATIRAEVDVAMPGSYEFIEMPNPLKRCAT